MVGHPADSAAAERVELASQLGAADPVYRLPRRTPAHRQDDGAILERRWQAIDEGDHTGAPGGEEPRFMARGADDEGRRAGVPGVDDAAERQIGQQERVGLIHDQRGRELLDGAVDGGDRDVGRRERSLG